jgi:hypothetical protein
MISAAFISSSISCSVSAGWTASLSCLFQETTGVCSAGIAGSAALSLQDVKTNIEMTIMHTAYMIFFILLPL